MKQIRRHFSIFLSLFLLLALGAILVAIGVLQSKLVGPASLSVSYTNPPQVSATAVYIADEASGQILYTKQPDLKLPIASVTKLIAATVFFKLANPIATTTIAWSDVNTDGRSGRLKVGQQYTNHNLLFPTLLESSNDAAAAMLRAQPNLIEQMNEFSRQAGALNTHLVDSSGLSDQNIATARDLATLLRTIAQTEAHIIDITTLDNYLNHTNAWLNNNPFIKDETYRGGKHGFTLEAKRTAAARFAEQFDGQERVLDYIILGSADLASDMKILRTFVHASVSASHFGK